MNELLELGSAHTVFEIGTGSGYQAATIAEILRLRGCKDGHVYTVEFVPELAHFAYKNLRRAGYLDIVTVICSDGSLGLPLKIKADRVLVTASMPDVLDPLINILKEDGILVGPVGRPGFFSTQKLVKVVKRQDKVIKTTHGYVAFVPLRGRLGW